MASSRDRTSPAAPAPMSDQSDDELLKEELSPLTTIVTIPDAIPSTSITTQPISNAKELSQPLIEKQKLKANISMGDVSLRLRLRKQKHDLLQVFSFSVLFILQILLFILVVKLMMSLSFWLFVVFFL